MDEERNNNPMMVDPYIYRLMHEQAPEPKPEKPSFFKKFVLLVLAAIVFGAVSGGVFIGIRYAEKRMESKKAVEEQPEDGGVSELEEKKPKSGIVVSTATAISETAVSAVDVSAIAESTMPSVVAINNYSKQSYNYFFYDFE